VETPVNCKEHVPVISPARAEAASTRRKATAVLAAFFTNGVSLTDRFGSRDRAKKRQRKFEQGGNVIAAADSPGESLLSLV